MKVERLLVLGIAMCLVPRLSDAQAVSVTYDAGLISIQCHNAPLSEVFEVIEREAGVELTLEDPVKSKRLTADLSALPVAMAVQRLLEGAGVVYIVMMDPYDWGTVDKIFIGTGGGGPARSAAPPDAPEPEPVEEPAYDELEAVDPGDQPDPTLEGQEDPNLVDGSQNPDEFADPADPGAFPTPSVPSYLPPTQNFPRSRFTPGPNNQPYQAPQQPQQDPNAAAGAFPYLDPFGRPIPAPPNQQQQQQRRQQQQQQQQQ